MFLWCAIYFAAFWMVRLAWSARKFRGDSGHSSGSAPAHRHRPDSRGQPARSSARHAGIPQIRVGRRVGMLPMLLLPLLRVFHYQRFSRWIYTPLLAAFALFVLLMVRGSGPTGSDAQSESRPVSTGRADQDSDRLFPGRIFRAQDGNGCATCAENVAALRWLNLPRLSQHALPVMLGSRDRAGHVFPVEGPRAGARHRISVSC